MRRLTALLWCLMLALTLGSVSSGYAGESLACVDGMAASMIGHADGDGDQVPADGEKAYPHHHGGCARHQAGVPVTLDPVRHGVAIAVPPLAGHRDGVAGAATAPALRPPQA